MVSKLYKVETPQDSPGKILKSSVARLEYFYAKLVHDAVALMMLERVAEVE